MGPAPVSERVRAQEPAEVPARAEVSGRVVERLRLLGSVPVLAQVPAQVPAPAVVSQRAREQEQVEASVPVEARVRVGE